MRDIVVDLQVLSLLTYLFEIIMYYDPYLFEVNDLFYYHSLSGKASLSI